MTWSTSQLADLARVTVNTVRHYHAVGLLQAPERNPNGYKQYSVQHLVRLIQIRRLTELGMPLSTVLDVWTFGLDPRQELGRVDAALEADLARHQQSRADIAALIREDAPVDTPRGFEPVASRMSNADRAVISIVLRLSNDASLAGLRDQIARASIIVSEEFAALPPDADVSMRERIANRMADDSSNWRSEERLVSLVSQHRTRKSPRMLRQVIDEAFSEFYNAAQRDVIARVQCRHQRYSTTRVRREFAMQD